MSSRCPCIGIYVASVAADRRLHEMARPLRVARWSLAIAIGVPVVTYRAVRELVPGAAAEGAARRLARALMPSDRGPMIMEDIGNLFHGFAVVLQPYNIVLMIVGILLGVIIGVLPGLGGANGVAILLPLTFSMSPTSAIIMLSCIYWGALFGGAITSILFNIPGEPWSVATTFDGHPMAQQGRAGEALTAAFTSSFVGALFAVIMITLLAPLVASFALQFGPPEFFAVYFLAFCSFIGMGKEPPFKTHRLDDARLRARRGRPRPDDRPAAPDLRLHRTADRLRLPDRGDRPVRHRRDPADAWRRGSRFRGKAAKHQPEGGAGRPGRSCRATG